MYKLLHDGRGSKTAMPQRKMADEDCRVPMEDDVDMTSSLRDVTDLYPCMIVMCGSAGGCMAVSIAHLTEQL